MSPTRPTTLGIGGCSRVPHLSRRTVVEVGALKRARGAKKDRIDAIRADREARSQEQQAAPRAGGLREALRMVLACREGVLLSHTKSATTVDSDSVAHAQAVKIDARKLEADWKALALVGSDATLRLRPASLKG
jgi:hypothetical protein